MFTHRDPHHGSELQHCYMAAGVPGSTPTVPMPLPMPGIPPLDPPPGTIDPPPDVIDLPDTPHSPPEIIEPQPDVIDLPSDEGSVTGYSMEAATVYNTLRRDALRWQSTFG